MSINKSKRDILKIVWCILILLDMFSLESNIIILRKVQIMNL